MQITGILLHAAAYCILTAILVRVAYRSIQIKRLKDLPLSPPLQASRERVVELLDLETIKITLLDALAFVGAHTLLAVGSILDVAERLSRRLY